MSRRRQASGPIDTINVTPFVDTLLVLLVILITTANRDENTRETHLLSLRPPSTSESTVEGPDPSRMLVECDGLRVSVPDPNGRVEAGYEELSEVLDDIDVTIYGSALLRCDETTPLESIVFIIAQLQRIGIPRVSLEVRAAGEVE